MTLIDDHIWHNFQPRVEDDRQFSGFTIKLMDDQLPWNWQSVGHEEGKDTDRRCRMMTPI